MRINPFALGLAVLAVASGSAWPAYGQPGISPAEVDVVLPTCNPPPFALAPFLAVLTLELRADGVGEVRSVQGGEATHADPGQPERGPLARILLDATPCDENAAQLVVTVDDAATSKQLVRHIGFTDVTPAARPRAMALAVAELLRASWLELAVPPAPPSSTPPPPAPPPVPVPETLRDAAKARVRTTETRIAYLDPPNAPPASFMVGLGMAFRAFPSSSSMLLGGRMFMSIRLGPLPLRVRLDVGAGYGTKHDSLGDIDIGLATGGFALLVAGQHGAIEAEIGPRIEGGFGWVSGRPVDAFTSSNQDTDFVSTASLLGAVHVRLGEAWRLSFEVEGGTTLTKLEANADNRRVAGISGPLVGGALGLTYAH